MNFSTGEWIAIVGIILASVLAIIQIIKRSKAKNSTIKIDQKSGCLSKGNQNIHISTNQSEKND